MGILKDRFLISLMVLGLLTRLLSSPLPGFQIDINTWFGWTQRLNQVGFSNFYSSKVWTDYTPGYLYIFSVLGLIKNLLPINNNLFYLLLKLPFIVSEIILGAVVYRQIYKKSSSWAKISAVMIFFNPAFIFNSAIWGQLDGFFSLLLLITIYYLNRNRSILASTFFGLSLLFKPQALAIAPLLLFYFFKPPSIRNFVKILIPGLLVFLVLSFPFFTTQLFLGPYKLFINLFSDYPYTSLFAYNFWGMIGFWIPDNTIWHNLSYSTWGYILFITYLIFVGFLYFKKNLSIFILSALLTLGFFFLPTRVHERYLYPAIIFLIISASLLKSRLIIFLTAVLSIIHFLNLYYVYVYYNEFYLKLPKTLYNPIIYNSLGTNGRFLSIISTIIFVLLSIAIIRTYGSFKES